MPSTSDRWVRRYHPAPEARTRLVCLPHAGGSASYFHGVSKALSPAIDVLAVQYPGRQDRASEPGVPSIEELADQVVAALRPWADRPLTLFGHSMGASLGFEVGIRLEAAGVRLTALFASGRRAPSRHRHETVHLRDDEGLIAEVKSLAGTASSLLGDEEVLRMVLPAIRNDYRAAETYRPEPGPRLSCPVLALVGDRDPKCTVDEARSWGEHTGGAFELRVFPGGGHFYLNDSVPAILDLIRERADPRPSASPAG
ncbi:thioesterase II family protein [Streptomyces profundus]|uniref:thioesterase II family protein n=1 Tax=Streptomyces profundus TaxID=2867410 RepID=UPI001D160B12|nr:alpha/beta fold hydrolase [Streptomyces sp. MA3_2.13]UED87197.1 alpha/beta fold hydrolase [Streptomyces sp. MA3_2.13]